MTDEIISLVLIDFAIIEMLQKNNTKIYKKPQGG